MGRSVVVSCASNIETIIPGQRISETCLHSKDEDSSVVKKNVSLCVCMCVCVSLTLLISLDFGKCRLPVEDEAVEAELVVQGLLRILQRQSEIRINNK